MHVKVLREEGGYAIHRGEGLFEFLIRDVPHSTYEHRYYANHRFVSGGFVTEKRRKNFDFFPLLSLILSRSNCRET